MKTHRLFAIAAVILCLYAAVVLAQQQAAEAPPSAGPLQTRPVVTGLHGIVAAGHPIASSAGLQILLKGGNAFDAAAAVGAMAALGEPEMNGIGGNGFMTVYDKKTNKVWSLSMTGAAPKALNPAEMTPETLNAGMKAGIVPGNLGGYLYALDRFGTMSLADVFAPAIEYAEKGYPIDPMLAASIDRSKRNLSNINHRQDLSPGGNPVKAGELLKNADAATLRKLVERNSSQGEGASRSAAIKAAFDRFTRAISLKSSIGSSRKVAVTHGRRSRRLRTDVDRPLHDLSGHDIYGNPHLIGGFES
jgi:gamma-glutamyltranspeptidase/glutathione hydrolase